MAASVDSLRIALIAPPWFSVPPAGYGGTEWVVSLLAEGLVARGHDVTLFASGGSRTSGRLVSVFDVPPSEYLPDPMMEGRHLARAYRDWRDFDVIHDHTALGPLIGSAIDAPVVHTVHCCVDERNGPLFNALAGRINFVAISEDHASTLPEKCQPTVIYNGIDLARFPEGPGDGGYLLWVGRISPQKGIVEALEIARRSGLPLKVLAKVNEPEEHEYWEAGVGAALGEAGVDVVFNASHEEKLDAFQHALCTLFPITWREPFGLVMIESMACGTPVLAFRQGSVPEIVADGQTGFVCRGVDDAVASLAKIGDISRSACRRHVLERFTAEQNVIAHEELYRRIIAARRGQMATQRAVE